MKNYILFLIASASAFSFSCLAQGSSHVTVNTKIENAQLISNSIEANNDLAVVSYHVEERINMNFGGTVTTYDVPNLNMVNTYNLGPNNTRVITPRYGKAKAAPAVGAGNNEQAKITDNRAGLATIPVKIEAAPIEQKNEAVADISANAVAVVEKTEVLVEEETIVETDINKDYITVNIVDMGERVLESGGEKTIENLKLVANARFFEGNLTKAAKWYTDLFKMTTDLDAVYYFRYGQSLKAVGQTSKSKEMMAIYESKK